MSGLIKIQGTVVGENEILYDGMIVSCWENSMQAAVTPMPLILTPHEGKVVEVQGYLHGDLWEAELVQVVLEEGYQKIEGEVVGDNVIEGPDGPVYCYRHGVIEAWYSPLILTEYLGKVITVSGELHGSDLHHASIVKVPDPEISEDPAKEAKSLKDLLKIREANSAKIEAVNGNLGTALGYKWTNNKKTDHPCIIIFVPQKTLSWLVPEGEAAPPILKMDDGTWCFTDVVTGGKAESLADIDPMPELRNPNKMVVEELRSGRIGLIGGIQLAFFGDGIRDSNHTFIGTAGIAVRQKETQKKGFLTNQHVAEERGRRIYHPLHNAYQIGVTKDVEAMEPDEVWYEGIIDEENSYVRCDCGFVEMDDHLESHVKSGLYAIGKTGSLLKTNVKSMDIIGQKVISVGRTRGVQRGTIAGYAYEYFDGTVSFYTDFLIIGEEGNAFSDKGDSGKVIVTDDEHHRPVALLWGGWQERLRKGREQEKWSYTIDLAKVLNLLNLELLK